MCLCVQRLCFNCFFRINFLAIICNLENEEYSFVLNNKTGFFGRKVSPFWIAIKLIFHVCYDYVTGSGETFVHSHHSVSNLKYIRFGNSIYFRDRLRFYCYLKCNKKFELSWLHSTFACSSSLRALFFFSLNVFVSSWITQVFVSLFHINVYSHLKIFFVSLVKKNTERR